jgi:nucleoside-diphosphate-sugar epimerase
VGVPVKKALVTGHMGFVGRHMKATLEKNGYLVYGVDVIALPPADARDYFRTSDDHYDVVVHAAAVIGGRAVIDGDPLSQAANFELDAAMFQWAARTRPGRVVYLSSSAVYPVWLQHGEYELGSLVVDPSLIRFNVNDLGSMIGTNCPECHGPDTLDPRYHRDGCQWVKDRMVTPARALQEDAVILDTITHPDQLYGWSKLTGEKLAALARADGVPVTVVRPFSGYGEDQDTCYPFPAFAARARDREDPFNIWGTGEQTRDWIHIDDICTALMVMISDGIDGPVNLGTGIGTSMRQLVEMMCDVAGYQPEIIPLPGKPAGVMHRVADVKRMSEFFTPRISLAEGVSRAVQRAD